MRTRMYGGVTGKASDGLPMSIAARFAGSVCSNEGALLASRARHAAMKGPLLASQVAGTML